MKDGDDTPFDPGLMGKYGPKRGVAPVDLVAAALSLIWVAAILAYLYSGVSSGMSLGLVLTLLIVFLPLVLIWTAAITLRSVRSLRKEAQRLQATVEAMRNAYLSSQHSSATLKPAFEKKIDEIAQAARSTENTLASFTSRRDGMLTQASADRKATLSSPQPEPNAEQPALALGTPAESLRAPLTVADFIRALQFPENPDDREGFRALRAALEDRETAKLIRAAQDVLTLLSQEGIFMDDLVPERARPDMWRRFAGGERGRAIAALGGVRDRSSLALAAARMREDTIFRDAAHHFLRCFDKAMAGFEKHAADADLVDLAETRTARAFMLLGRVTGTFD